MDVAGKVILVTGGASGIGRATALEVASGGARVIIADRQVDAGVGAAEAAQRLGADALSIPVDTTREADCIDLAAAVRERHGRLDAVICAAGILRGAFVPVDELDEATFAAVVDVNLRGTFLVAKHTVPLLRESRGVLLLIASGAGVRGGSSSVAYGSSKGGVHGLALVLEAQLAPSGIRVHAVCPGNVNTPMKRENVADAARSRGEDAEAAVRAAEPNMTDPVAVARVLRFLVSDAADAVRGTIFTR